MMQSAYSLVKVNNEIELCEVNNQECKQIIEKELLKNRVSYFIKWNKGGLFSFGRNKNNCIFCVNDSSVDLAEEIVQSVCEETGYQVRFLFRHSSNKYL